MANTPAGTPRIANCSCPSSRAGRSVTESTTAKECSDETSASNASRSPSACMHRVPSCIRRTHPSNPSRWARERSSSRSTRSETSPAMQIRLAAAWLTPRLSLAASANRNARPAGTPAADRSVQAFEQPGVDLLEVAFGQRQVAIIVRELRPHAGNVGCQPLAVTERDETVLAPVVEQHRRAEAPEPVPPRLVECPPVLPPAFCAGRKPRARAVDQKLRQLAREHGRVGGRQQRLQHLMESLG